MKSLLDNTLLSSLICDISEYKQQGFFAPLHSSYFPLHKNSIRVSVKSLSLTNWEIETKETKVSDHDYAFS